jgi:hypothetical protein
MVSRTVGLTNRHRCRVQHGLDHSVGVLQLPAPHHKAVVEFAAQIDCWQLVPLLPQGVHFLAYRRTQNFLHSLVALFQTICPYLSAAKLAPLLIAEQALQVDYELRHQKNHNYEQLIVVLVEQFLRSTCLPISSSRG